MPRTVQDIDAAIAADRARQLAKIATRDRRNQDMLSALRDIEEYERQIRADETAMEQLFAMVEPAQGEPDMPPLLAHLNALGVPLMAIVEHDMYPAPADAPLPIATRTRRYYSDRGLTITRA